MKNHNIKILFSIVLIFFFNVPAKADKTTTGFWQEMHIDTAINTGIQRTGQQVYEHKCYECHARNTQGAPMPGDHYEWNKRYQKGFNILFEHTLNGFNKGVMPKRGGCKNCSKIELKNAIIYMLNKSGIEINQGKTEH